MLCYRIRGPAQMKPETVRVFNSGQLRSLTMPKEILFSSYECNCGHQSHFSENTVREAKEMSHKRKVHLGDAATQEHIIVFDQGTMVEILCPKKNQNILRRRAAK